MSRCSSSLPRATISLAESWSWRSPQVKATVKAGWGGEGGGRSRANAQLTAPECTVMLDPGGPAPDGPPSGVGLPTVRQFRGPLLSCHYRSFWSLLNDPTGCGWWRLWGVHPEQQRAVTQLGAAVLLRMGGRWAVAPPTLLTASTEVPAAAALRGATRKATGSLKSSYTREARVQRNPWQGCKSIPTGMRSLHCTTAAALC